MNRQQQGTTGLVVLAVLLVSLGAGALGATGTSSPADRLTASRSILGVESAVPPNHAPALRPSAERPHPGGRLVPLLLGMLVAALAAVLGRRARRRGSDLASAGSRVCSTQLEARAPPTLQPA